jgi:hypothetical protein
MAGSPLALIEFPADDPERARRFWSGLLDLALERRSGEGEGEGCRPVYSGRRSESTLGRPVPEAPSHCPTSKWTSERRPRAGTDARRTRRSPRRRRGGLQGLRGKPLRPDRPRTRRQPIATIRRAAWSATDSTMARRSNTGTARKNGALRSFEWTPGAFSAKEVPATEQVYGPEQADGTCTGVCAPNLGGAKRRRVARHGRRVKRRRELTGRFAGRTW